MERPSIRSWILALLLAACTKSSDSGSSGLAVRSISVPDFGRWECNRPIEFAFDQPIDFASVSTRSVRIRTQAGLPAVGTFTVKTIDADDDGEPERTDERVVVFFPRCPEADDLSDAGLTPGARYLVTLTGADTAQDPDELLRSISGEPLPRTVFHAFETIADPRDTLYDERPGPPAPRVGRPGSNAGSYLELGPANRVFFVPGPAGGETPSGFQAPLNLLGDPATHVAFVIVFDQAIRVTPANLARLGLEYNSTLAPSGWRALETRVEVVSNCRPLDALVRLVPLGSFPRGGFVRVGIAAGFEDPSGQATGAPSDDFVHTPVSAPAFASLDPAGATADELHEEFDFGAGSPLSFADPSPPLDAAPARWGDGELRANHAAVLLPPELREFDLVVRSGEVLVLDTNETDVLGGPEGLRTIVQHSVGGLLRVRNLTVQVTGELRIVGPNPAFIHVFGTVEIRGRINASGLDGQNLSQFVTEPADGGAGVAGGGSGGSGSAGTDTRGGAGSGAFGRAGGGGGGESGFAPTSQPPGARRGGGGGGGRFARDQGMHVAEDGGSGAPDGRGVESGNSPARGGSAGPEVFRDGDPSNDFFGIQPIVDASGAVIGRRRGELDRVHAGSGGGNAGESIAADSLPLPANPPRVEGGGGGGGGGGLVIRALGPIVFGPDGQIRANGGSGGRKIVFSQDVGASGGSGSGGHVILESARFIDFTGGNPLIRARPWIVAVGGPRIVQLPSVDGFGGAGGPGVIQLHVPHPERAFDDPESNLILPGEQDPLQAVTVPRAVVLYPGVGSLSRARSRWIPLGAAGKSDGSGVESVVGFSFAGLETAEGDDHGKVLTSGGRVVELAPLLGPAPLAQPGIELLSDGIGLALSGPVLAPLLASAQPISPDVYLRTPALLEGHALRLANPAEPGARLELTIARAHYDDASPLLTLTLGGLAGTLAEAVAALGGEDSVELTLVPRFFRVRQGTEVDLLPDSRSVRILFQGATDDGTGRPNELVPLVDWTANVAEFGALPPGALDFVRFQVEFELDASEEGFDPQAEPLALDFLRLPFRF